VLTTTTQCVDCSQVSSGPELTALYATAVRQCADCLAGVFISVTRAMQSADCLA